METTHSRNLAAATENTERSDEMNRKQQRADVPPAPLYASPWLAFFYVIRQGWDQLRP